MTTLHKLTALLIATGLVATVAVPPALAQSSEATVVGTVVRFSNDAASIDVTIGEDNPTVRDFLSRLPLTITIEEYAEREKIGYFENRLVTEGAPGSDPENGDLIYFIPWGNIGFYYNAVGIDYSDQTVHLGTYDATPMELGNLEGAVTVEVRD